jgi:hypothetical protein
MYLPTLKAQARWKQMELPPPPPPQFCEFVFIDDPVKVNTNGPYMN